MTTPRIRLHDLMKRASPYLPVAVDAALQVEIMALCQEVDMLQPVLSAAKEVMLYEKSGSDEGHLYWEEKYQALYSAVEAADHALTPPAP